MKQHQVVRIDENGNCFWYVGGKIHREDGPAIVCHNGLKEWRLDGLRHRVDGPAVEHPIAACYLWYLYGTRYSRFRFDKVSMRNNLR